ncbi:hypothetical protein HKL94_00210 [Candidatus Parcubacteria bacterium]|nr:hypothetical protein [Candidatus Parcubacteria bacterium]
MDTQPISPPTPSNDESLKKYIRTFAGDMEIVKKGGIPDLKPLEATPRPLPTPVEKSAPPPPVEPVSEPPKPQEPPQTKSPASILRPPKPPLSRMPEEEPAPLETYTNDFLQRVKDTHASTATVLAAEEDAGTPEKVQKAPSHGSVLPITAGVLLLLFGGLGVYIAYTHYAAKMRPVTLAPSISAPIFVDEEEKISGETPGALLEAITQSITHPPAQNAVRLLYTDLATTTGNSVFSALQFPAPGILLRNINAAQSMAGIVNIGGMATPFFILSVTSYSDTFAGMLSWEATMPGDLSTLFPPYPPTAPTTMATTTALATTTQRTKTKGATSTPSTLLPLASFHDEVVSNHDVRIYRDAAGQSVLMYGYWNKTTLVIARDPAAFTEILRRLATSHTQ